MNRWIWAGASAVLVAICVAALVFVPDTPEREIARLNRQIEVELPVGTGRAEIEKWLNDRESFEMMSDPANYPRIRWAGVADYFWYWSGELTIAFWFDEQDRLWKHHIEFEEDAL